MDWFYLWLMRNDVEHFRFPRKWRSPYVCWSFAVMYVSLVKTQKQMAQRQTPTRYFFVLQHLTYQSHCFILPHLCLTHLFMYDKLSSSWARFSHSRVVLYISLLTALSTVQELQWSRMIYVSCKFAQKYLDCLWQLLNMSQYN